MTYAEHQETAARALADLLTSSRVVERSAVMEVLQARRQAMLALRERLEHLGWTVNPRWEQNRLTVRAVAKDPAWQLSALIHAMPQPDLPSVAPSQILSRRGQQDSGVPDLWRTAARGLFLATAELERAEDQPWLSQSTAAWYVVADIADTVGALVALDERLHRAGALQVGREASVTTRLLIAGDVARLARAWGG